MIILDIDNTIANDGWRIPRIQWQHDDPMRRYHEYHSLSAFDQAGNHDLFVGRSDVIILTARPVHYRSITEEWLRRNGVNYEILIMRNDDDHSHSKDLKRKQVGWLRSLYEVPLDSITCAYDDRLDVVEMYRSIGIHALVRGIHDVCAYTKPEVAK